MKENTKLVKRGWSSAMLNQGTLSLIMMLDDFLISGPYMVNNENVQSLRDNPNVIVIQQCDRKVYENQSEIEQSSNLFTYYILRPFIRGILYGLNSLYQISLYIPLDDPQKMKIYREIVTRIDIGDQFFDDRIYWNLDILKRDILDRRLACLIYPTGSRVIHHSWLNKITLETKPFRGLLDADLTDNTNLFDLVEIRSFLEEMHQRFFSRLLENKNLDFTNMIRSFLAENNNRRSGDNLITYTSGFCSASWASSKLEKPFMSDRFGKEPREKGKQKHTKLFTAHKKSDDEESDSKKNNPKFAALLQEYEQIIQEQLQISHTLNQASSADSRGLTKSLCRWNSITMRKSDLLKLMMRENEKTMITKTLGKLNRIYYEQHYLGLTGGEPEVGQRRNKTDSESSDNSCSYLVISADKDSTGQQQVATDNSQPQSSSSSTAATPNLPRFTTWYTRALQT